MRLLKDAQLAADEEARLATLALRLQRAFPEDGYYGAITNALDAKTVATAGESVTALVKPAKKTRARRK